MEITVLPPPTFQQQNVQLLWSQLSQHTIEVLVAELYRAEYITFKQAQQLLNHTNWQETYKVLKEHGCQLYYDVDDFEDDIRTLTALYEIDTL